MPTKKKHRRTVTTSEEEVEQSNPIPGYIRSYLNEGDEEHLDELRALSYAIKVYQYQKDGRAVLVTGRTYENLETLPYELGAKFGNSRFRVFITASDAANEKTFVRLENFEVIYSGEDDPPEAPEEEEQSDAATELELEIEKLKLIHEHELKLRTMEYNQAVTIAALNSKGGAGPRTADLVEMLKLGIGLAKGGELPLDDVGENEEGGLEGLMKILNSPLGRTLAGALAGLASPPGAPASAAPAAPPEPERLTEATP